jgi:hypothetical protein
MAGFRKFLLIGDVDSRLTGDDWQLDSFSWRKVGSIPNAADYDIWIISLTALSEVSPAKVFTRDELGKVFDSKVWLDVLAGDGHIFIVGDIGCELLVPASLRVPEHNVNTEVYRPFQSIFVAPKDLRPVDFRRVNRGYAPDYPKVYRYMDQAEEWKYSIVNPSVQQNFRSAAGIETSVSAPEWSRQLLVPGQAEAQKEIESGRLAEAQIRKELEAKEKELSHVQRWKRLLYDDGFGLEEICKTGSGTGQDLAQAK